MLSALSHLDALPLLSELRSAFGHMITYDQKHLIDRFTHMQSIPVIHQAFGGEPRSIEPFNLAWQLMYAAICRLDKLQDSDPIHDAAFAGLPVARQYNQVFAYYLLAEQFLNTFNDASVPAARLFRLRRLWSEMMLRMASGQERDLSVAGNLRNPLPLGEYQEIAQFKTGATFALAFGGTAALNTDDREVITALTIIGEIYGTLLQYSDDLVDWVEQSHLQSTFPAVLTQAIASMDPPGNANPIDVFFVHLCRISLAQVQKLLQKTPVGVQDTILSIFQEAFHVSVADDGVSVC